MKKKKAGISFISLICVFLLLTIIPLTAHAAAPQKINYQGYLTDSDGVPVDGTVQITFAVYDVDAGGTALWNEAQTVTLVDGVFNVNLGEINPISLPFDTQYYLGVQVGTDTEMTPRPELTSAGYSFSADEAGYAVDADTVDGHQGTDLEESAEIDADIAAHTAVSDSHHLKTTSFSELTDQVSDGQIPAEVARDTEVAAAVDAHALKTDNPHGVTAAQVGAAVDLNCTGCVSQSELDFSPIGAFTDTGTSAYYTAGNVGIGTTSPIYKLSVAGDITTINSADTRFSSLYDDSVSAIGGFQAFSNNGRGGFILATSNNGGHLNGLKDYDSYIAIRDAANDFHIGTHTADNISLTVKGDTGNIGIGTMHPKGSLHVNGTQLSSFTGTARGIVRIDGDYTAGYYSALDFAYQTGYAVPTARIAAYHDGSGSKLIFGTSDNYSSGITNTAMTINNKGNVGIGTMNPDKKLTVFGDIRAGGDFYDGWMPAVSSGWDVYMESGTGRFGTAPSSSIRYKENIAVLDLGLEAVMQLYPVSFDYKNDYLPDAPRQIGLIAEDVAQVSPLLAVYAGDQVENVKYKRLTAVLIKAVQELKANNDTLRERLEALEAKVQ